jgi:hypothetical protein
MRKSGSLDLPEALLDALKRFVGPQPLITLLNDYKGVALTSEAHLLRFDRDTAALRTHPHQIVCLALNHQTRVQSRTLSLAVQARVAAVEAKACIVRLTDFRPAAYTTERRLTVQPDPARSIEIELSAQNWTTHGRLETISLTSLTIYLPASEIFFEPEIVLREGSGLHTRFQLPGANQLLELTGRVIRSAPQQEDVLVSIALPAQGEAQQAIRDYIVQRRATVAQELQARYEQMTQLESSNGEQTGPAE